MQHTGKFFNTFKKKSQDLLQRLAGFFENILNFNQSEFQPDFNIEQSVLWRMENGVDARDRLALSQVELTWISKKHLET